INNQLPGNNCGFFASADDFRQPKQPYWRYGVARFRVWVAMRAGWKMTAAARVVRSESAISLPMLDGPGWWESHRLPKAMAVGQAVKKMAGVRLDCRKFDQPAPHATI